MREPHFTVRWALPLTLAAFMTASFAEHAAGQSSGGQNRDTAAVAEDGIRLDEHFWDESTWVSLIRSAEFSVEARIPRGWTVDGDKARLLPPVGFRDVCVVRYALEPGSYRDRLPVLTAADQRNARDRYQSTVVRSGSLERVDIRYIGSNKERVSRSYFETGDSEFLVVETIATGAAEGLACGKAASTIVDNLKLASVGRNH